MAPIYESDLAEERWEAEKWRNFELWEIVEKRIRRRNFWLSLVTLLISLSLFAFPNVRDRLPFWRALSASHSLLQVINGLKARAAVEHKTFRLKFLGNGSLTYLVTEVESCKNHHPIDVISTGFLIPPEDADNLKLLSHADTERLGLGEITEEYCYDPLLGDSAMRGEELFFGIIPANDLTQTDPVAMWDRLSLVKISTEGPEIIFD